MLRLTSSTTDSGVCWDEEEEAIVSRDNEESKRINGRNVVAICGGGEESGEIEECVVGVFLY